MVKRSQPVPEAPASARLAPLLEAVRALYGAMDRFDQHAATALGVDRTAVRALNLLERGPVSPGALGQALTLSSGAVTALLLRLEGAGHITRVETDDGRRRDAALTAAGRRAAHREFERLGRAIGARFAGRGDGDLDAFVHAVAALAGAFEDASSGDG